MIQQILNAPMQSAVITVGINESPQARILEDKISTKQNVAHRGQMNCRISMPMRMTSWSCVNR